MTELLQGLIDFVVKASPALWEILIKQVYAEVVENLLWTLILGIACRLLFKLAKHGVKKHEEDSYSMWELWAFFGGAGSVTAGLISAALLSGFIKMLINPEFYAIRFILQQLGGN